MVWLWGQFGKFYGNMAARKYGDIGGDTFSIWQDVLRYFDDEQIKAALEAVVLLDDKWPPELQLFVNKCNHHRPDPAHETHKALTVSKSSADYAAPWREQLRASVGLGGNA